MINAIKRFHIPSMIFLFMMSVIASAWAIPAKQVFVLNNSNLPTTLDPAFVSDIYGRNILMQMFEGLTTSNPHDLTPQPGMATRWSVSKDGRIYTFFLNPAAVWSDGTRVTAEDFVFAWQRVLDPKLNAPLAYNLYMLKNARAYNKGEITDINAVGMRAVGPDVLEVTLEYAVPYFLQQTSFFKLFPVPKHMVMKNGNSWADPAKIVSNGAFLLLGKPENNLMIFKKNTRYWDAKNVKLAELRIYGIQDSATVMKMYADGKLDFTGQTTIPSPEIPKWRYTSDYHSVPWFGVNFLRFNTSKAPFNDLNIRRAFGLAIDKQKIVNFVVPVGHTQANSFVPSGIKGYVPAQSDAYDPNQARKLLSDAGYCTNGNDKKSPMANAMMPTADAATCKPFPPITILVDNSDAEKKLILSVQQMLMKELGLTRVTINVTKDFKQYLESRRKMDYDIARSGWVGDYSDPSAFLEIWTSDNTNNNTGWKNARYDELIRLASSEQNERKRMELFKQAEALLLGESPVAPIYNFAQNYLLKPYVRNYLDNMQRLLLLKDVYIEHYSGSATK